MIPKECKRLAEVDFPIAEVSRHAVREKSIRHGHPSTLHLWWARRPLASSRAVLMALLLPDPCDEHCPAAFKEEARRVLLAMHGRARGWTEAVKADAGLRRILLKFIADFANWDKAADPDYLKTSRALVQAAHGEEPPLVVDPFAGGGSIPLEALRVGCEAFASDLNPVACLILKVMLEDIPRHGPKLAEELRDAGRRIQEQAERELADLYPKDPDGATPIAYLWARTVRCEAPDCGAEIPLMRSFWLCKGAFSRGARGGTPRKKKSKRKRALRPRVLRHDSGPPEVAFEVFEPAAENDVHTSTVDRAKATCLCCGAVLPPERVRLQLSEQRGGADAIFDDAGKRIGGARMTAVVTLKPGEKGRHYRLPTEADYAAVRRAQARLADILSEWEGGTEGKGGTEWEGGIKAESCTAPASVKRPAPNAGASTPQRLCPVPDEPLPPIGTLGFRVQRYGMLQWGDLFTARQALSLLELSSLTKELSKRVRPLLSIAIDKTADLGNALAPWKPDAECPVHLFARQAIGMAWDFCESVPPCDSSGSFISAALRSADALNSFDGIGSAIGGQVQLADATRHPLPDAGGSIWFTDPPYYDAVPYSDLSDFFLVWLKRVLQNTSLLSDPFDEGNPLSPKEREAVQDETKTCNGRVKDRTFFEDTMGRAFTEGRRILQETGVGSVVFAHKTTEGWEALLSGLIQGGWTITGSWPIATEMGTRLRARDSAALATSVHLICRPRPEDAPIGEWADVLRELPKRVADWMRRLQGEGVRGADLVFACVGPALEIYSRHRAVETVDGREVALTEYLEKVWEVVGRAALQQVLGTAEAGTGAGKSAVDSGDSLQQTLGTTKASAALQHSPPSNPLPDALEEDARLTALFLWTLQSTETAAAEDAPSDDAEDEDAVQKAAAKGFSLPFDVVRRFSQPMGIDLDAWTGRIVAQAKGAVRLLPVAERAKALFGEDGAASAAEWMESDANPNAQLSLFPEGKRGLAPRRQRRKSILNEDAELQTLNATTLDRLHAAMLLQASGHAGALRALIAAEQERGPAFLRLANALTALYPRGSQEKRLLDAMLLAVPR